MKLLKAGLSIFSCIILVYALNTKNGDIPPLGKFLSPFTGFWKNAEATSSNKSENLDLKGLKGAVVVQYDLNRVPHIFASNNYDLYFAQGYVTAKDRLWQMEFQTHAAAGRISEIVGEKAIELDRYQRRIGMVYGAQQSLAGIRADPETKESVEAFTAGVNAYIKKLTPADYPIEYKLLDYEPESWTPLKCALLLKLMAYDLAGQGDDLYMTNILNKYGLEVVQDLFPDYPFREVPIVPVGTKLDFKPVAVPAPPANFSGAYVPNLFLKHKEEGIGSNNWAVSGAKSVTGYPLLANDPHLQLNLPSIWYQVQLVAPGINAYGVSLPGAPNIIIGFNKEVSWGVTNVDADVQDWYQIKFKNSLKQEYWHQNQWKPIRQVTERIKVRGKKSLVDTVYYTHHGPVVYHNKKEKPFKKNTPVFHAFRWIAHEKSNEIRTFYLLNRASNYQDYLAALTWYTAPAQNFIYADVHQDIAVWVNGKFPLKYKNQGKFILDGTNLAHDWSGWVPQTHNPHLKNPERGFVFSANQFSTGPDYPYYLNWQYASPDRAIRISQRLAAMQKVSVDSLRQLQNDNFNILGEAVLPVLLSQINLNKLPKNEQQAWHELKNWRYLNNANEIPPTIFDVWWQKLTKAIWHDEFKSGEGLEMRYPSQDRTIQLILQEPQAQWFDNVSTPIKETLPYLVTRTFSETMAELTKLHGPIGKSWEWGRFKNTSIQHIASLPGFGKENIMIGGGPNIINATGERKGPSWRMVVALGPQVKGYGVYPGGQSGNPGSFYYDNMIETWRMGKLNKLVYLQSANEQKENVLATLNLQPE
ncbi:penicillin acylase family protein [Adhaeribacter aquaticus]|uniref:penicillin acylase family protein n=1 Tax=Adhaeribacter aquaticus TaxID=299567 RepID=UPI0003F7FBCD|nr:penicillin acylase family protein [Adhaeribacter aquaticus]